MSYLKNRTQYFFRFLKRRSWPDRCLVMFFLFFKLSQRLQKEAHFFARRGFFNILAVAIILRNFFKRHSLTYFQCDTAFYDGKKTLRDGERALKKNSQDLISIIMPSFNRGYCIERSIRSVMEQSYSHWELFVVDDGSTDDTEEVLQRLVQEDSRVHFIKLFKGGVSRARNEGLRQSQGAYVAYLDSDDTWHKHFLVLSLDALKKAGASFAYSASEVRVHGVRNRIYYKFCRYNRSSLEEANFIPMISIIHSRKLLESKGGFDEKLGRWVDWDFILRLTKSENITLIPYLLSYIDHNEKADRITNHVSKKFRFQVLNKNQVNWAQIARPASECPVDYAFIVSTFNRKNELKELLTSIRDLGLSNYEIIPIETAGTDGTNLMLAWWGQRFGPTRWMRTAFDFRIPLSWNIGAGLSRAKNFIFLNDHQKMVTSSFAKALKNSMDSPTVFMGSSSELVDALGVMVSRELFAKTGGFSPMLCGGAEVVDFLERSRAFTGQMGPNFERVSETTNTKRIDLCEEPRL